VQTDFEQTQSRNGDTFARRAWWLMAAAAVVLGVTFVGVQRSSETIRGRRAMTHALEQTEGQIEAAVARTADRTAVESEVEELLRQRAELEASLIGGDLEEELGATFRKLCARADLRFEGLAAQPVRRRGALDAVPCRVSFSGLHQQVPVLMDGFYTLEGLVFVTGLDLEVVNFIDDRVTGTLTFEVPRLRPPPPPDGEILRPFLPVTPAGAVGDGAPLEEAQDRLASEYRALLDYETSLLAREHYTAEAAQLGQLHESQGPAQADVARALPTVVRALQRTALGRGGFRVEPGGAVEFLQYD